MIVLALDSSTRIIEVLGYSGAGVLVGLLTGFVLRAMFRDVNKVAFGARRQAEVAVITADEARIVADEARIDADGAQRIVEARITSAWETHDEAVQ